MAYLCLLCAKLFSSIDINCSFKFLAQPYEVDTIIPHFTYRKIENQKDQLTCQLPHN